MDLDRHHFFTMPDHSCIYCGLDYREYFISVHGIGSGLRNHNPIKCVIAEEIEEVVEINQGHEFKEGQICAHCEIGLKYYLESYNKGTVIRCNRARINNSQKLPDAQETPDRVESENYYADRSQ